MRNKLRQMFLTGVFLVYVITMAYVQPSSSQSQPVISVSPPKSTAFDDESFTVDITIADVTLGNTGGYGICAWEVNINFSSTVLNAVSVMEGPWLKNVGTTMRVAVKIDNSTDPGTVKVSYSLFPLLTSGALESGILCNITFLVMDKGVKSDLLFVKTLLRAWTGSTYLSIDHTVIDGFFTNVHDVSVVSVSPSTLEVQAGASVSVDVVAANEGDFSETFSVIVYRSIGSLRLSPDVGTQTVTRASGESKPLSFSWDTSGAYAGNYTLSAVASMVAGEVKTANNKGEGKVKVSIAGAPRPSFIVSSQLASVGETVQFNSTSYDPDGTIESWEWDFDNDGDLPDATTENATWTYAKNGTYTPILYVTDNDGRKAFTYETINVTWYPVASFTHAPLEALVRQPVTFNSTSYDSDGYIVSWEWDFNGDDTIDSHDENATYTYNEVGTFKVSLTVTDNGTLTDTAIVDLVVSRKHDVSVVIAGETYKVDYGIWAVEALQTEHNLIESTYAGFQKLNVTVTVENIGTEIETFYVKAYYNDTLIGSTQVVNLAPRDEAPSNKIRVGVFPWNTLTVLGGDYTIKVVADLESDQNINNNVKTWSFRVNRADVAIKSITVSTDEALAGSSLNVTVVVKNVGTELIDSCSLDVNLENATDSITLSEQSIMVKQVAAGSEKSGFVNLNFTEANILPGVYVLSVEASKLIAEYYVENNNFEYGNITVGASLISIHADLLKATVGSTVNVNGTVTPNRSSLNVIVRYREKGAVMWRILKRVTTDVNGTFSCTWSPGTSGTYELQAIWDGDTAALGSQSDVLTVVVEPAATNVFLYAGAGAAIAFVLVVAIYFVRFRKPKEP